MELASIKTRLVDGEPEHTVTLTQGGNEYRITNFGGDWSAHRVVLHGLSRTERLVPVGTQTHDLVIKLAKCAVAANQIIGRAQALARATC